MKLKVVSTYIAGNVNYPAGVSIEVDAERGAFLLRDAPGCFEVVEAEAEAPRRSGRKQD